MRSIRVLAAAAALSGFAFVAEAAAPSCDITFRIGTSTPLISASLFAIYQNAPGEFDGTGASVNCSILAGTGAAADADQTRTLTVTTQGIPNAINGPKDMAKCKWTPTSRFPVAGDFNLSGQSGFNTSFQQVNANITISTISCSGSITTTTTTTSSTTTTSTTTTTLPLQLCGDVDGNGKLQTSDALAVLRAAVGQRTCDLCVCDMDGNGTKSATDALVALRKAVGLAVQLKCPSCAA